MKKYLYLLLTLVVTSVGLVGCASTHCDTCDGDDIASRHAGHSSHYDVQILHSNPAKAYQKLGDVSVTVDEDTSRQRVHQLLKEKAAHRGADAVVIKDSYVRNGNKTVKGSAITWNTKQHD